MTSFWIATSTEGR